MKTRETMRIKITMKITVSTKRRSREIRKVGKNRKEEITKKRKQ